MKQIRVFSPATLANLGSGFDLLGLALETPGDIIIATPIPEKKLVFISDPAFPDLPTDHRNVACHVAQNVYDAIRPDSGVEIRLQKNIPPASGMGGSGASSAAAACAVNWLFDSPYSKEELLSFAMEGERLAAGSPHADNVAPALFGGLCLLSPGDRTEVIQLPVKIALYWSVVHPACECNTRAMRELLPKTLPLAIHITQSGCLATLITGLLTGTTEWISRGLSDLIAEPERSRHIPGFADVRNAAMGAGALGFGISGSGPALFAVSETRKTAEAIADSMQQAFLQSASLVSNKYVSAINTKGTHYLEE